LLASIANVAQNKENVRQELLRWSDYGATISGSLDSVLAQVEGKLTYDKYFPAINGSLRILEQGIQFR
jgi:hypothetical protein